MPHHLDGVKLDNYLARSLDRHELRMLDEHVASCPRCTLAVEREGLDPARWRRRGVLGRLVAVPPEHEAA